MVVADPDQETLVIAVPGVRRRLTDAVKQLRRDVGYRNGRLASQPPDLFRQAGLSEVSVDAFPLLLTNPDDAFGLPKRVRLWRDEAGFTEDDVAEWSAGMDHARRHGLVYGVDVFGRRGYAAIAQISCAARLAASLSMVLVGRVATGRGDLKRWMVLYADAYAAAVGVPLYPGSLNVVLEEPWALPPERLTVSAEAVGRLIYLVPCSVGDRRCFIFRTDMAERAGGDEHRVLEIVSDVRLRDALGVDDGDTIEIVVDHSVRL